jgi:predicted ester cyclase
MGSNENIEVIRSFIRNFWNEGNLNCTDQYLTSDYVDHAYVPNNKVGLEMMARTLNDAFPDQVFTEESILAQGDCVVVRLRLRGTHLGNFRGTEATNHLVDVKLYREFRLKEGKISEHWALLDTASLFRQIGAELHEQPVCQIKKQ